jgi:hypothetical protein
MGIIALAKAIAIVGPSRIALQQTLQPIVGNNSNAEATARFHRQRAGAVSASFTAQSDFIPAQSLPNPAQAKIPRNRASTESGRSPPASSESMA